MFVRHGESNVTVQRVIGGPLSCTGLSDLGRLQAAEMARRIAADDTWRDAAIVSSSYPRAIETANALSAAVGDRTVEVIGELGEQFPGERCDGMTFEEYVAQFGNDSWSSNPYERGFPGGETVAAFQHRVAQAVMGLASAYRDRTVIVSCHGGVIDRVMRLLLHAPPTGLFELHTLNCSITEFSRIDEGTWRLHRYNDVAHLAGLPTESPRLTPGVPKSSLLELREITPENLDLVLSSAVGGGVAEVLARSAVHPGELWARVAMVADVVVGFVAAVAPGSALSPAAARDDWFVTRLAIDRTRERAGYGRRTIELAREALAGPDGRLWLSWPESDPGLARFAKVLGFEPMTIEGGDVLGRIGSAAKT